MNSTDRLKHRVIGQEIAQSHYTREVGKAMVCQFTANLDDAMGIEPCAAWPIIAELHTAHGYSAWYDLGVIMVVMLGVGTMYLSSINGGV